jgi:hypothetical protein
MEVKQIYELINAVTAEVVGQTALINEDLSNVVDIGTQIFNATAVDNYVKSLVNHIGKVIFVNRPYSGNAPSVLMDGWEYGSVLEKIQADIPEAEENESWDLTDGESYDPNIFYKPSVSAKFFNKRVTFEVPMSFTERQVKESFSSAEQLNGFLSMLYNAVDKSLTVKMDSLVMRTINNMTGETITADYGEDALASKSGVKAVNLLYLYNHNQPSVGSLTPEEAITNPDFIRFAAYKMGLYTNRLSKLSRLFNIGGKDRFTPADMLHVVMLTDFKQAANVYLQSDVFHDKFTAFPAAEEVPYWQGSGTGYDFASVSGLNISTASGATVNTSGVLCVMFDRDALGVTNIDRRVTTNYNGKAEFYNNWFKFDAGYFNDTNENFVVFFVA